MLRQAIREALTPHLNYVTSITEHNERRHSKEEHSTNDCRHYRMGPRDRQPRLVLIVVFVLVFVFVLLLVQAGIEQSAEPSHRDGGCCDNFQALGQLGAAGFVVKTSVIEFSGSRSLANMFNARLTTYAIHLKISKHSRPTLSIEQSGILIRTLAVLSAASAASLRLRLYSLLIHVYIYIYTYIHML